VASGRTGQFNHDLGMARSKSILCGIAGIVLIAALVVGLTNHQIETRNPDAVDEPRRQSASSRVRHRLTSSEARENLSAVLSGRRKAPDMSDSKLAARMQYYNDIREWIAALSLADCVMLIDGIESDGNEYDLIYKLYIRHGELDPKGALQRIGGDPPEIWREPVKLDKLCCVLQGWARVDPKSAWDYFERWRLENGSNIIRNSGLTGDVAYEVFCAWVNQDSKTAFANLLNVHPKELLRAGQGYYFNLPRDSDFPAEARKLDHLIDYKQQEVTLPTAMGEIPYFWQLSLCTKWANRDPDSASEWWLNKNGNLKRDDSETAEEQQEGNASWLGLLIANWAGNWREADGENNADAAVGWIMDNPKWFRERNFRDRVLPAIARHRPMDALRLIKQIETSQERSYQLSRLVQAPSYQNIDPSRILDPDTVESELSTFQLADDDLRRVQEAVAERREYEAKQPAPQSSAW
jgi:hypothetical protein